MAKLKLKITGMHCTSCAMNIDGDLEDFVEGIKSSSTSYAKQECVIDYDEGKVKVSDIINQVKKTGYKASVT